MKEKDENVFQGGEYVVLLSSCDGRDCWRWRGGGMPENYCYRLADNSETFKFNVVKSLNDKHNGWVSYNREWDNEELNKLKLRRATPQEISHYKAFDKPFDVRELNIKMKKENYNYLKKIFKKLNIK
jgi:hypothetical protein